MSSYLKNINGLMGWDTRRRPHQRSKGYFGRRLKFSSRDADYWNRGPQEAERQVFPTELLGLQRKKPGSRPGLTSILWTKGGDALVRIALEVRVELKLLSWIKVLLRLLLSRR